MRFQFVYLYRISFSEVLDNAMGSTKYLIEVNSDKKHQMKKIQTSNIKTSSY